MALKRKRTRIEKQSEKYKIRKKLEKNSRLWLVFCVLASQGGWFGLIDPGITEVASLL